MQVRVVSFQKHKRMSVVQFLSSGQNSFDYISGSEAMRSDLIQVKEVSQSGSVNDLYVYNLSDKYVFFMDGDILTGAKQNRVLNTSVLLSPNSKVTLPVSCVEQGRWDNLFSGFTSSDNIAPQKLRANKARAVKENREIRNISQARQSEVWKDVENYSTILRCSSPTSSLNDIYEKKKEDFQNFLSSFTIHDDANGLAVFADNKLLCTDLFNRTEVYKEYFPKLLRSSAMETAHLKDKENKLTEAEAAYKTINLFDSLDSIASSIHKGIGVGEERRFETEDLTGLQLEFNKHIIHLTALNIEKGKDNRESDIRRNRIH
jgi:hypothetical protein